MHVSTHLDVDLVALEAEDQVTLMLDLAAPERVVPQEEGQGAERVPATVQIVLDRSGSMEGERLDVAKRAIDALVARLAPDDRFGLVAFDDQVQVVLPASPLTDKTAARHAVAAIQPGGTTNLSGGLLRGLQEARRVAGDGGATLVLLSDGHANVGETDPGRLGAVAAKARERRITTSTIGVGLDHDEHLLAEVARGGAGNAHFAEEADTAGGQLAGEIDGLLSVTAQAASVLIAPSAGVEGLTVWNDVPAHGLADGVMLEVGDLYAGEQRKLLVTLTVPRMAGLGLAKVADVTLRWVALPELTEHTIDAPVFVNVVPGDAAAGRVPDPVVRSELAFQQAQRRKREAARAMREGRAGDAADLYLQSARMLNDAVEELEPENAVELLAEADVLSSFAERAQWDDHRRVAKESEADSGRKSRKRGR